MRKLIVDTALMCGFAVCVSVLAPPFRAQTGSIAVTRIWTSPEPVWFTVDGTAYPQTVAFSWPTGSKHTLYTEQVHTGVSGGTRYTFQGWFAGDTQVGIANTLTVSADPSVPEYKATFNVEVALKLSFYDCDPDSSLPCAGPGTVWIAGAPFTSSAVVWVGKGSSVTLLATPGPGYVFDGWTTGTSPTSGPLGSITVNQPITITPRFLVARKIQFETVPEGLSVMPDRTPTLTPLSLDWGRGTTHTVSVVSPQQDRQSKYWVFSSWSDGKPMTHAYTVPDSNIAEVLTATFLPGVRVSLLTSPPGLKLKTEVLDTGQPYNFTWGVGETHSFEAPALQTDAQGRTWQFAGWSDGLPAAHSITIPADAVDYGIRITANYRQLGQITVNSNVTGVAFTVDGDTCDQPCIIRRPLGTPVQVSAPASVGIADGTRGDFQGWSSGAAGALSLTAGADLQTVTANYKVMQRLSLTSDPPEGTAYRITPDSSDGYYDSGARVSVLAMPKPGFRFVRWDGDLTGSVPAGTLTMSSPRLARATLSRVPYIPPAGVRNGAGDGPTDGVAPGSVILISGVNMASAAATGPDSPLSQTLGDVTVRFGDSLLPLFFVSPDTISAQLPNDLPEGPASLGVRSGNQAEVRADFNIVRNAPGLFRNVVDDQAWAVAAHADGSLISKDSPAGAGEAVTLYGTGFGATTPARPLGFAIPPAPAFSLVDPVTVRVGDAAFAAGAAFAAPAKVGVDAVQFRLPDTLPAGAPASVSVKVGDRESNTVLLPVR